MSTCAVVRASDGLVLNLIVAEPTDTPPYGCLLLLVGDQPVGLAWSWDGKKFVSPYPEDPSSSYREPGAEDSNRNL